MAWLLLLLARLFGLKRPPARAVRDGAPGIVRACGRAAADSLLDAFEQFIAEGGVALSPEDAEWADDYLSWIERCAYFHAPARLSELLAANRGSRDLRDLIERLRIASAILSDAPSRSVEQARAAFMLPKNDEIATRAPHARRALALSG